MRGGRYSVVGEEGGKDMVNTTTICYFCIFEPLDGKDTRRSGT